MVDIAIVNGDYKPTYNWGAHPTRTGVFFEHLKLDEHLVDYTSNQFDVFSVHKSQVIKNLLADPSW